MQYFQDACMPVCAHGCIHLFGAGAQAVHMLYRLHWGWEPNQFTQMQG